jgi:hypothetical protein
MYSKYFLLEGLTPCPSSIAPPDNFNFEADGMKKYAPRTASKAIEKESRVERISIGLVFKYKPCDVQ